MRCIIKSYVARNWEEAEKLNSKGLDHIFDKE